MSPEVCGVVLAAGEGRRLRPITEILPKALCPVGNVPLLDRALARFAGLALSGPGSVAVNAAYLSTQVCAHVADRVHVSVEPDGPLGTSGGVARLRDWIDGRGVLVANSDAYLSAALPPGADVGGLLDGWDGDTVRMLTRPTAPDETAEFSGRRFAGLSLLPWRLVKDLPDGRGELIQAIWRPAEAAGALDLVSYDGTYLDTGTPTDYLAANLHAVGPTGLVDGTATVTGLCERSVVGARAVVHGRLTRSVVWPYAVVAPHEHLTDTIRVGTDLTVPAV